MNSFSAFHINFFVTQRYRFENRNERILQPGIGIGLIITQLVISICFITIIGMQSLFKKALVQQLFNSSKTLSMLLKFPFSSVVKIVPSSKIFFFAYLRHHT